METSYKVLISYLSQEPGTQQRTQKKPLEPKQSKTQSFNHEHSEGIGMEIYFAMLHG